MLRGSFKSKIIKTMLRFLAVTILIVSATTVFAVAEAQAEMLPPTNLRFEMLYNSLLYLNWDAPSDETDIRGYVLESSVNDGFSWEIVVWSIPKGNNSYPLDALSWQPGYSNTYRLVSIYTDMTPETPPLYNESNSIASVPSAGTFTITESGTAPVVSNAEARYELGVFGMSGIVLRIRFNAPDGDYVVNLRNSLRNTQLRTSATQGTASMNMLLTGVSVGGEPPVFSTESSTLKVRGQQTVFNGNNVIRTITPESELILPPATNFSNPADFNSPWDSNIVPPTGLPSITTAIAAMITLLLISTTSWLYILHRKYNPQQQ